MRADIICPVCSEPIFHNGIEARYICRSCNRYIRTTISCVEYFWTKDRVYKICIRRNGTIVIWRANNNEPEINLGNDRVVIEDLLNMNSYEASVHIRKLMMLQ
jgi:hypothetical protein